MREDIHILNEEEVLDNLKKIDGWEYKENKISKEFKFKDFMDCLSFVVKLAPVFEMKDHHPDIHIFYNKILFELQRFDVGGKVTDMDFFIASQIDKLYKER